eukprot:5326550-Pyramimonas_sp.AAC.1
MAQTALPVSWCMCDCPPAETLKRRLLACCRSASAMLVVTLRAQVSKNTRAPDGGASMAQPFPDYPQVNPPSPP